MEKSIRDVPKVPQSKILLGVCSSIAAHRALDLASILVKEGHEVQCVLTPQTTNLIGVAAFEAITTRSPIVSLWNADHPGNMDHLAATKWADIFVIAPATANTLGMLAHGVGENALGTLTLAWNKSPLIIAPAMNPEMWKNLTVQENVSTLRRKGHRFIGPVSGSTACGDMGMGRLAPVEEIHAAILKQLSPRAKDLPLTGHRILITSGPTREFADDVRCLTNPSSGKMGIALARQCLQAGAEVSLITGPTEVPIPEGLSLLKRINTAEEMLKAVLSELPKCRVAIFAAAVSDFRPAHREPGKYKKKEGEEVINLQLERTPDIALNAHKARMPGQIFVGFAAESQDLNSNAKEKLDKKGFEFVFANPVNVKGAGFGSETNQGVLLFKDGSEKRVSKRSKEEVARLIVSEVETLVKSLPPMDSFTTLKL